MTLTISNNCFISTDLFLHFFGFFLTHKNTTTVMQETVPVLIIFRSAVAFLLLFVSKEQSGTALSAHSYASDSNQSINQSINQN